MIKLCAVRGDDHGLDAVEDVGAAGLYDTKCTPDRINIVTEVSRVCVCERESVCVWLGFGLGVGSGYRVKRES